MNVTRNVINDLLPLYAAGEASPDTVALVDEYLAAYPDLVPVIESLRLEPLPGTSLQLQPNKEKETLNMTKKYLRLRGILLGIAIAMTLMPASFQYSKGHFSWTFLETATPAALLLVGLSAAVSWVGFFLVRHRLEHTGL